MFIAPTQLSVILLNKHGPILEKVSSKTIINDFEHGLFKYSHRFDLKSSQNCMKESRKLLRDVCEIKMRFIRQRFE